MSLSKFKVQIGTRCGTGKCIDNDSAYYHTTNELPHHPSLSYLWAPNQQLTSQPLWETPPEATIVSDSEVDQNPTAAYLKSLTCTMLDILCNDKDLSSPLLLKHIAPSFAARQDDRENSKSRDEHLAVWAEAVERMPNYRSDIIDSVTEIHESGRKAKVWTLKRLSGIPTADLSERNGCMSGIQPGICKEGISCMNWELRGQVWMCVRLQMIRGVAEFD